MTRYKWLEQKRIGIEERKKLLKHIERPKTYLDYLKKSGYEKNFIRNSISRFNNRYAKVAD